MKKKVSLHGGVLTTTLPHPRAQIRQGGSTTVLGRTWTIHGCTTCTIPVSFDSFSTCQGSPLSYPKPGPSFPSPAQFDRPFWLFTVYILYFYFILYLQAAWATV